jgi:hypothetical protein
MVLVVSALDPKQAGPETPGNGGGKCLPPGGDRRRHQ